MPGKTFCQKYQNFQYKMQAIQALRQRLQKQKSRKPSTCPLKNCTFSVQKAVLFAFFRVITEKFL